jgi:hypothetical protein
LSASRFPFHELEFSRPADFWEGDGASERCVFLMPVTPSSEFLAFGVLEPLMQVHFVARGRLVHDLGVFLEAMLRGGARIELYVRAPVPRSILERYTSTPPIEYQEAEEPPEPPVRGLVPEPTVRTMSSLPGTLWAAGDASARRVILTPTHLPAEFFALGLSSSSDQVLFQLRGSVQDQLGGFVTRMVQDQARVELHPRPPTV